MITLATATKIADAAFEEGKTRGLVNMSVVVTDLGGNIRVAMRADGQGTFGIDIAKGKAATALGFNTSSLMMGQVFGQNPAVAAGLTAITGDRFLPLGGGVIIQDDEGLTIGAAGVCGGAPETDHAVIVAALKSAGVRSPE